MIGYAHKRQALAIRRPNGALVAIYAREQVLNCFLGKVVHPYKSVVATVADKGELGTIGRPGQAPGTAANRKKLFCRTGFSYIRQPHLTFAEKCNLPAFRRKLRAATFSKEDRTTSSNRQQIYFLPGTCRVARRIRSFPLSVGTAPSHKSQHRTIRRKHQATHFLPIISIVR